MTCGVPWILIFSGAIFLNGGSNTTGAFSLLQLHATFLSHRISPTHYRIAHWFSGPLSLIQSPSLNLSQSTSLPAYTNPSIVPFLFFPSLHSITDSFPFLTLSSSQPSFLLPHLFPQICSSLMASGIRVLSGFITVSNCSLMVVSRGWSLQNTHCI